MKLTFGSVDLICLVFSVSVISADGWSWTEVQMHPGLNPSNVFLNRLAFLLGSELICLPPVESEREDEGTELKGGKEVAEGQWPTVAILSHLPLNHIRTHLNRRLRARPRRPPESSPSSSNSSSSASSSTTSESRFNPLVRVFDELPGKFIVSEVCDIG